MEKLRALSDAEYAELYRLEQEKEHYRVGMLLTQMRIDYINSRPQMEYAEWLAKQPLEF